MKEKLKMMSFFAIAFCTLWLGKGTVSAATFKIDVINGQDGSGINYGTITTTKNDCTVTSADSSSSQIISIGSGQEVFVEVEEGCTQTFKISVNEGYEIESVLMDRQYVEASEDGTYTFNNITTERSLCVKYKKAGTPTSPDTGDVSYVLPVSVAALFSVGAMIVIVKKKRHVKA